MCFRQYKNVKIYSEKEILKYSNEEFRYVNDFEVKELISREDFIQSIGFQIQDSNFQTSYCTNLKVNAHQKYVWKFE